MSPTALKKVLSFNHIRIRNLFKYITVPILILFILFWAGLILYQKHLQNKVREKYKITAPTAIDTLQKVNLGGIDQWCLIRGWDKSNPVLLYLHGGPGGPLFPRVRTIESLTDLVKHFIMVYWEQRGTGKSYYSDIPIESMTISQFTADIYELTQFLKSKFGVPKIYLLGVSWGSLIGMLAAHQHPESYYAFIGVGQSIRPLENDRITYQFCLETARKNEDKNAMNELETIGSPPYDYRKLIIQRKWLTRFEKMILSENGIQNHPQFNTVEKLLSTPEYSLWDILSMGLEPYFSLKYLWNEEFYRIDLFNEIPEINIPVYFFMGRHDYITSGLIAGKYYEQLIAPEGKKLIWFEKSGHEPYFQEPGKFHNVMINVVLKETSLKQ
jgi:pimeloyl-ACP methyl ester carboxylesterase